MVAAEPALGVLSEASDEIVRARYGHGRGDMLMLPGLGIPVKTKDSFEGPPSHVAALADALPRVSRVLIIGWRGGDEELSKLLASGLPAVTPIDIVSRGDGWKETQDDLGRASLLDHDYRCATDGFSGFMRMAAAAGALPRHRDLEPTVNA